MAFDESRFKGIFSDVLGIDPRECDASLSRESCEKWDSFSHLDLVLSLEEAFHVRLRSDLVPELRDYTDVEREMRAALGETPVFGGTPKVSVAAAPSSEETRPERSSVRVLDRAPIPRMPVGSDAAELSRLESAGGRIGTDVEIGSGSRIDAQDVWIGDGVRIGPDVRIRARRVYLAAGVSIGQGCEWIADEIRIGEGSVFGDRVVVDVAGGGWTSHSVLDVGVQCSVTSEVILNVARPIVLQDGCAVSPRAMLYTHSYWQSALDGYPVQRAPIHVGRDAWIGAGATVLPGVRVGAGSVVMASSCVTQDVPERVVSGGVPARVMRAGLGDGMTPVRREQRLRAIVDEFLEHVTLRGATVIEDGARDSWSIGLPDGTRERLYWRHGSPGALIVSTAFAEEEALVLDLERNVCSGIESVLGHELRGFLRRHGIRLEPHSWRWDPQRGLGRFEPCPR